jgi:hypothetical protein
MLKIDFLIALYAFFWLLKKCIIYKLCSRGKYEKGVFMRKILLVLTLFFSTSSTAYYPTYVSRTNHLVEISEKNQVNGIA